MWQQCCQRDATIVGAIALKDYWLRLMSCLCECVGLVSSHYSGCLAEKGGCNVLVTHCSFYACLSCIPYSTVGHCTYVDSMSSVRVRINLKRLGLSS